MLTWNTGSSAATLTKVAQLERDKRSVKNNRLARALLLMLEHQGTNWRKTGGPKWSGKISIEHILPRNLSKPGADWGRHWTAEKQLEWLHRLGKLAMLNDCDNSSLGNCGFKVKIDKIKTFQDSASWTVRDLLRNYVDRDWDEASMQDRHTRMLEAFQERWGLDSSQFSSESLAAKVCFCTFPSASRALECVHCAVARCCLLRNAVSC